MPYYERLLSSKEKSPVEKEAQKTLFWLHKQQSIH